MSTPQGKALASGIELDLKAGDRLLIRGRSGCGKSTLIRAIAGIWPYADGEIIYPKSAKALFLSQRPYLPLGTLREAACYPLASSEIERGLVEKYFSLLGLDALASKLDLDDNWSQILSLGEQQRVAIIRALVQRPDLLILDEATSALDAYLESRACGILTDELKSSIFISVGHKPSLMKFHNLTLSYGEGKWVFARAEETSILHEGSAG